jgi:hypothetical protein
MQAIEGHLVIIAGKSTPSGWYGLQKSMKRMKDENEIRDDGNNDGGAAG